MRPKFRPPFARPGSAFAVSRLGALLVVCFPLLARAQTPPFSGLELNAFRATSLLNAGTTVVSAERHEAGDYRVGLLLHESYLPLVWKEADGYRQTAIRHQLSLELSAAVAPLSWLQVGAALPLHLWFQRADTRGLADPPATPALGDARVDVAATFLHQNAHALNLGVAVQVQFPSGGGRAYAGNTFVGGAAQLVGGRRWQAFDLSAQVGARVRGGEAIFASNLSQQLTYGVMGRYALPAWNSSLRTSVAAEVWGHTALRAPFSATGENVLEWMLSARTTVADRIAVVLGIGGGFIPGIGSGPLRALLSIEWAPRSADTDWDGLRDNVDACPLAPESFNQIDDSDGCPESDRDGDGIMDRLDQCPDQRETTNLFEDEDGCPDRAPPNCAQDADEDDRCPEPASAPVAPPASQPAAPTDSDRDGIWDAQDLCPKEQETINGVNDDDGCPDKGKAQTIFVKNKGIMLLDKVNFETGSAVIKSDSLSILNQIGLQLRAHPEVKKLQIEGHTDSAGQDQMNLKLSQERTESVRSYLVEVWKIENERLLAKGFGESRPIAPNTTPRGRAQNRRVEFIILEQ